MAFSVRLFLVQLGWCSGRPKASSEYTPRPAAVFGRTVAAVIGEEFGDVGGEPDSAYSELIS